EICDVEEELSFGTHSIRHHWTIDELRVDPEQTDPYHEDSRIAVHRCLAWLRQLVAGCPLTTDTEESGASAVPNYAITLDAASVKAEVQDRFDNGADPDLTDDDVATVFRTADERIEQLIQNFVDDSFWQAYDDVRLRVISQDRKSTRLNSSHVSISYAVFCLNKKTRNAVEAH